jgi:hypothetical protein
MSYGRAADPRIMMDKIVDIEKPFDGDLKDLLEYLADRYEIKFVVDAPAFATEKIELPGSRKVQLPKLPGVSLDTVLRYLLAQTDAVFEFRGQAIVILPNREGTKHRNFPPDSQAQPAARKAMRDKIAKLKFTVSKDFDGELKEILEGISDQHGISIIIDAAEFRHARSVDAVDRTEIKLKAGTSTVPQALDKIVGQIKKGRYEIFGDHVRILPIRDES